MRRVLLSVRLDRSDIFDTASIRILPCIVPCHKDNTPTCRLRRIQDRTSHRPNDLDRSNRIQDHMYDTVEWNFLPSRRKVVPVFERDHNRVCVFELIDFSLQYE